MKQIGNCYFIFYCLSFLSVCGQIIYCTCLLLSLNYFILCVVFCGHIQCVQFSHLCSLLSQPQALWTPVWWSGTWNLRCEHIVLMDTKMLSFQFSFLPLATWWPPPPETRQYVFGCPACESSPLFCSTPLTFLSLRVLLYSSWKLGQRQMMLTNKKNNTTSSTEEDTHFWTPTGFYSLF